MKRNLTKMRFLEEFRMKKINISKQRLRKLYEDKKLSSYDIAKIYKCNASVIQNRLREYKIKIRHPKEKIKISKEELIELYVNKKLSTYKIAKIYNCGSRTIYGILIRLGINPRQLKRIKISKDKLMDLYYKQKLSYSQIAKKYNCSASIIFDKMKKYKILPRSASEANTIYPKKDFSGNLVEKAYLIGFRLGDLNVKKEGYLIKVKTNTTKTEQVELIKNLFGEYGNVNVGNYKEKFFGMDIGLNKSFYFLVPKEDDIDKWILRNNKHFLAFLAGYTDAEGNIGVYSNRARVRIGSYDKNLLYKIHKKLISMNLQNTYRLETFAGTHNQNQDFWRVSISKKEDLLKLLKLIEPYIKHAKRCKDLKRARENILYRIERYKK